MAGINSIIVQTVQPKSKVPLVAYGSKERENLLAHTGMTGFDQYQSNDTYIQGRASGRRIVVDPNNRYAYYMKPFVPNGAGASVQECESNIYKIDTSEALAANSGDVWSKVNTNNFPRDIDADLKSGYLSSASRKPFMRSVNIGTKVYVFYKKYGYFQEVANWYFYEYDTATDTWTEKTFPFSQTHFDDFTNTNASYTIRPYPVVANGKLYVFAYGYMYSGSSNASNAHCFREYDAGGDSWTSKASPWVGTSSYSNFGGMCGDSTNVYLFVQDSTYNIAKYNIAGNSWSNLSTSADSAGYDNQSSYGNQGNRAAIMEIDGADRIINATFDGRMYFYTLSTGASYNVTSSQNFLQYQQSIGELLTASDGIFIVPRHDDSSASGETYWAVERFSNDYSVTDHGAIWKLVDNSSVLELQLVADRAVFNEYTSYAMDGDDILVLTYYTARTCTIDRYDIENDTWSYGEITLPKPIMYPYMDMDENGDIYFFENYGHFVYKVDVSAGTMVQLNRQHTRQRDSDTANFYAIYDYIVDFCVDPSTGVYAMIYSSAGASAQDRTMAHWALDETYSVKIEDMSSSFGDQGRPSPYSTLDYDGNAKGVHNMVAYNGNIYRPMIGSTNMVIYKYNIDGNYVETFSSENQLTMNNDGATYMRVIAAVSIFKDKIVMMGLDSASKHIVASYSFSLDYLAQEHETGTMMGKVLSISPDRDNAVLSTRDEDGFTKLFTEVGFVKVLDLSGKGSVVNFLVPDGVQGYVKMKLDSDTTKQAIYRLEALPEWTDLAVKYKSRIELWIDKSWGSPVGVVYAPR